MVQETIEKAVQWMKDLAEDDSHGYSQDNRWGPDYDCSSAIITAWENAGVPVKENGATNTRDMYQAFVKCRFLNFFSFVNLDTSDDLKCGDVLLRVPGEGITGHTVMYIGNGQIVHASTSDNHPESGDQTGREICVRDYYNGGWNYVLRYVGEYED